MLQRDHLQPMVAYERRRTMRLSDHDLRQLDEARLDGLPGTALRALSKRLLADLKEARERLNQTPDNSSRPPSTRPPWERGGSPPEQDGEDTAGASAPGEEASASPTQADGTESGAPEASQAANAAPPKAKKRPGRRLGTPGASRTQVLRIDAERSHAPTACACCGAVLDGTESRAHTARHELELVLPSAGQAGLTVWQTKHLYLEDVCACGHRTRALPGRCPSEPDWSVELTEWHLVGPRLASFVAALSLRLGGSYRRIQEFLHDGFGLALSTALSCQACVRVAKGAYPDKARALAHKLLNDWDRFWVVLEHPHLPLTNNEAERALRHWVILRRISQGTRTEQGSRAFAVLAVLASVIDTCRKRGVLPWPYLAEALRLRRQGLPAPALPQTA